MAEKSLASFLSHFVRLLSDLLHMLPGILPVNQVNKSNPKVQFLLLATARLPHVVDYTLDGHKFVSASCGNSYSKLGEAAQKEKSVGEGRVKSFYFTSASSSETWVQLGLGDWVTEKWKELNSRLNFH